MAEFHVTGLDELMLSMQEIAEIPDDVKDQMLDAQANVVVAAQRSSAKSYGVQDTGLTISSIKKGRPKKRKGVRVLYVTPSGTRRRGKQVTRNAEIAFINEYGTRKKKARPFIRTANEACAEATTQAGFEVYHKWLKSKNL